MLKNNQKTKIRMGAALTAALAMTILPLASVFAYGPERTTFTANNPADYVTFNSMTDHPQLGDERNFVRIREAGTGNYVDSIQIVPGKEYEVINYFHNNAKPSLNTAAGNPGIARNTKLRVTLPQTVKRGESTKIQGEVSADNAKPNKVWDSVNISSPTTDVALRYVPASAQIHSQGKVNGRILTPEQLFTTGSLIGYSELNGLLPGCTEYLGYVTYKFKADFSDFTIDKKVSESGKNNWVEKQNANPSSKVDFRLYYKNTGSITQNNVNLKDTLPQGLKYVKGTTKLFNTNNPQGKVISDEITTNGVNIGDYTMGADATVIFTAEVDSLDKMACGVNNLVNSAQARTHNGNKTDTAQVVVQKSCSPQEEKDKCPIPGKGHLKKNDKDCYEPCKIPGKENLKSNDPKCGNAPAELPKTGPMEAALMIIAITTISGGIAYYYRSHEEMKKLTSGAQNENLSNDKKE